MAISDSVITFSLKKFNVFGRKRGSKTLRYPPIFVIHSRPNSVSTHTLQLIEPQWTSDCTVHKWMKTECRPWMRNAESCLPFTELTHKYLNCTNRLLDGHTVGAPGTCSASYAQDMPKPQFYTSECIPKYTCMHRSIDWDAQTSDGVTISGGTQEMCICGIKERSLVGNWWQVDHGTGWSWRSFVNWTCVCLFRHPYVHLYLSICPATLPNIGQCLSYCSLNVRDASFLNFFLLWQRSLLSAELQVSGDCLVESHCGNTSESPSDHPVQHWAFITGNFLWDGSSSSESP